MKEIARYIPMTPAEFRHGLDAAGISMQCLATMLGYDIRTVRRWKANGLPVPQTVAMIVRCLARRPGIQKDAFIEGYKPLKEYEA